MVGLHLQSQDPPPDVFCSLICAWSDAAHPRRLHCLLLLLWPGIDSVAQISWSYSAAQLLLTLVSQQWMAFAFDVFGGCGSLPAVVHSWHWNRNQLNVI